MGHMARTQARRMSRTVAIGAVLVMATAGSAMAEADTGELPVAGFTHISVVDEQVEVSLADIYSGHADADRVEVSLADIYSGHGDADRADGGRATRVGVDLGIAGPIAVETTYTLEATHPGYRSGWRYNAGPVILTVTTGTLTLVDDTCKMFHLVAGHTYIGTTGQVLNALLLPEKNPGVSEVGWFTTRLYPEGAAALVPVDAPCAM